MSCRAFKPIPRIGTDAGYAEMLKVVATAHTGSQSLTRFAIAYMTSPFLVKPSGGGSRTREGRTEKFPALESIQSSLDHSIRCTRIVQECTIHSNGNQSGLVTSKFDIRSNPRSTNSSMQSWEAGKMRVFGWRRLRDRYGKSHRLEFTHADACKSHKRAKDCGVTIIIFFQLLQGVGSADKI